MDEHPTALPQTSTASRHVLGGWLAAGILVVGFVTLVGYWGPRPDSVVIGAVCGTTTAGLLVLARRAWHRQPEPGTTPMSEYLAAVYAVGFWLAVALVGWTRELELSDAAFVLPPISVVPLAGRVAFGARRAERGRRAARRLHTIVGTILAALGVLLAVSFFFVILAPVPLAAAAFHGRAAYGYADHTPPDPRLGFMR